jgi:hypothetical protein
MTEHKTNARLLAVGGHTRNIGKTALIVDLIRAFPEAAWTAVKITQYGHGVCSINGESCGCAPDEHAFALDEEHDRNNRTDTSRFLVAGAVRSFWLRSKQWRLAEARPLLHEILRQPGNAILESNTLLQFLRPELYLVVLDPRQADFKESARLFLDRADAFVLRASSELPESAAGASVASWAGVSPRLVSRRPCFVQAHGAPLPPPLARFVRERFFSAAGVSL